MLMPDSVWNIEILEKYIEVRGLDSIYVQYHLRSSTKPEMIWPVKTRVNQGQPRSNQFVILILEGCYLVQGQFIGKGLFELKNGEDYPFTNIFYENLIDYRQLASYAEEDAVPVQEAAFNKVLHNGRCGYNAIGQSLGFPVDQENPDNVGKNVFKRLVDSGYDFKCTLPADVLTTDFLDSKFWLTSDISKFLFMLSHFFQTNFSINYSEIIGVDISSSNLGI